MGRIDPHSRDTEVQSQKWLAVLVTSRSSVLVNGCRSERLQARHIRAVEQSAGRCLGEQRSFRGVGRRRGGRAVEAVRVGGNCCRRERDRLLSFRLCHRVCDGLRCVRSLRNDHTPAQIGQLKRRFAVASEAITE